MRKRWIIATVTMFLVFMAIGCGIPQEEYDAVILERDSLQAELEQAKNELNNKKTELQTVQTELTSIQAELASAQSELETSKSDLGSIQTELDAKKSEVQSVKSQLTLSKSTTSNLQTKIDKATAYGRALNIAMYPTRLVYDIPQNLHYPSSVDWYQAMTEASNATGDDTLKNITVDVCAEVSGAVLRFWSHGIIMLVRNLQE